jgi:carbamoyltransferase
MNTLGINAFHADASAALVQDGVLVAAIAEERLNRRRHYAGFPALAVKAVLADARVSAEDIDHIAVSYDPTANLYKKMLFAREKYASVKRLVKDRLADGARVRSVPELLGATLGVPPGALHARVHNVEHHKSHMSSAFFVSPFEEAACLSMDGFGDFVSTTRGLGRDRDLDVFDRIEFPHSAGLFYTAIAQFLGLHEYGEESKIMSLAPFGKPTYLEKMRRLIRPTEGGRFELNLEYFRHHREGMEMTWDEGPPHVGLVFSPNLSELFGLPRDPEDPEIFGKWADIAHSAQVVYEEIFFYILADLHRRTGVDKLSLAGGCAQNSVANAKIVEQTKFRRLFAPPAPGDDGTAIGAAFYVEHAILKRPRRFVMRDAYTGPAFDDAQVTSAIERVRGNGWDPAISIRRFDDADLYRQIAAATADGKVVGWFQGRMEFGPRALGNRSIVADPRCADIKGILDRRIDQRATYRPFSASVLEEKAGEIFERSDPSPFMMLDYKIRENHRARIPAVTDVDASASLQTVSAATNPRYHALISEFDRLTGVPLVLNTSFNEREPIVATPDHALVCYLETRMDVLALGNWVLTR